MNWRSYWTSYRRTCQLKIIQTLCQNDRDCKIRIRLKQLEIAEKDIVAGNSLFNVKKEVKERNCREKGGMGNLVRDTGLVFLEAWRMMSRSSASWRACCSTWKTRLRKNPRVLFEPQHSTRCLLEPTALKGLTTDSGAPIETSASFSMGTLSQQK